MLDYYGQNKNLLFCPSAPETGYSSNAVNPPGKADSAWYWTLSTPVYAGSYGFNKWLSPQPNGMANATTHPHWLYPKPTSVMMPTTTPVFMDAVWINFDPVETDSPAQNLYNPFSGATASSEGMSRICVDRHGGQAAGDAPRNVPPGAMLPGGINMGFVDGHAELAKLQNLWNYSWHLDWVTPAVRPP